ncbi:MAG TPA: glycosyltransferase family 4 protein [Azospirillum sp.]|nr:glycosyltransferase family 4 protein [Azospirillum sp.]
MTDRQTRVVHVTRQFWPSVGGIEDAVLNLCAHQRREHGIDAVVITLDRLFGAPSQRLPARESVQDVPVLRIPWRGSRRYPIAPKVLSHLRHADIVHVHAIDFFFDFLALTRPLHKRPLVASTHGGFFHTQFARSFKNAYFQTVTRGSARAYDAIVACSDADAHRFKPITPGNLVTIENGANVAKFRDGASRTLRPTLLYFGRLGRHKRIDSVFAVLQGLLRSRPDWSLVVAGSEWDVTFDELKEAARQAGVADAVTFVPRPTDADLRALISHASYFVCPSAHEGFGIAAVEALSAGLIPVLSAIPPFEKLVARTGVGFTYDPDEPQTAVERLVQMSSLAPADAAALRTLAQQAAASYDWGRVTDTYVSLYRRVLSQPGGLATAGAGHLALGGLDRPSA